MVWWWWLACGSETRVGGPPPQEQYLSVLCPDVPCTLTYTLDNADLVDCFGYVDGAWQAAPPAYIAAACRPDEAETCTIVTAGHSDGERSSACLCELGGMGDPPTETSQPCCEADQYYQEPLSTTEVDPNIDLLAACGSRDIVPWPAAECTYAPTDGVLWLVTWEFCEE